MHSSTMSSTELLQQSLPCSTQSPAALSALKHLIPCSTQSPAALSALQNSLPCNTLLPAALSSLQHSPPCRTLHPAALSSLQHCQPYSPPDSCRVTILQGAGHWAWRQLQPPGFREFGSIRFYQELGGGADSWEGTPHRAAARWGKPHRPGARRQTHSRADPPAQARTALCTAHSPMNYILYYTLYYSLDDLHYTLLCTTHCTTHCTNH